mgnify:CR=1 FL=1
MKSFDINYCKNGFWYWITEVAETEDSAMENLIKEKGDVSIISICDSMS